MISVNKSAAVIVRQMIEDSEALGIGVERLADGTTVIDAGVREPGSLEAGRLFSRACLGGLGDVRFALQDFPGDGSSLRLPAVAVSVGRPDIACMGSQYAGWRVQVDSYHAIGSGPARALSAAEEIFKKIEYTDRSEIAILMLEGRELPGARVASYIAERCGVKPEQLILLVAPTASLVGSVQIAARSVETGLHKLAELGFDVRRVTSAFGLCPLAPVAPDDLHAIGRTNDAILYGSEVNFFVRADDDELSALIEKVPAAASRDYGVPFYDLFMRYNGDFYRIDRLLFSPARAEINNINSGRVFCAGRLNPSLIRASFYGS